MHWGLPQVLFLLGGAIPLILFLHSRKPQGQRLVTATLFIWERILNERPLSTRVSWLLRKNLLLILQLLAAIALIAALAEPTLLHFGSPSGDFVVVIDMSASMKARGTSGSRFDGARRELSSLIDQLAAGQRMMIIGAGAETRLVAPFTSDKTRLRAIARELVATDAPAPVKDAILFAHAFLKRGSQDQVVVLSDGAFAGAEEYARSSAHMRFVRLAGGEQNIGIIGFEVRRRPEQPTPVEVMVHLRNYTQRPLRVPLHLQLGEQTLSRDEVEVAAADRRVVIYSFNAALIGSLTAKLEIDDDFATDNQAYLAVRDAPVTRVHYVGPGNPFLVQLLRFFPQVQLTASSRWEAEAGVSTERFDLTIFDRVAVPNLTRGHYLLIDTLPDNFSIKPVGRVQSPQVIGTPPRHPLTQGLSLADLKVREALRVETGAPTVVLARSRETPLVMALERGPLRAVIVGFDLMASDLPLRVAFPVFFHNVLTWFQPQRQEFPAQSAKAGAPFVLYLPSDDNRVTVTSPGGKSASMQFDTSPLVVTTTLESGFYQYQSASRAGRFAVNLFDEAESDIVPRGLLAATTSGETTAQAAEAGIALWPWLVAAVLALLITEAYFAHRRGARVMPMIVRGAALAAMGVAMLNPRIFKVTDALDVVVGVDLSRSVGQAGREAAQELLAAVDQAVKNDVRTGLLSFGRLPEWEFLPRKNLPGHEMTARLEREETDIQAALQAALAQVGEGRQGKVVLISDGNENRGQSARVMPLLRAQGTQVWTLPVSLARERNEIYLSNFDLPQKVDSAEGFEIRATIESLRDAPAHMKLLRDGVLQTERAIELKAGANPVAFHDSLTQAGNHGYELLIESADDLLAENNLLQGAVEVKGPPRVLLLSSQGEQQSFLARALQVQGYAVTEAAPENYPLAPAHLASYELVVLDNVPAFKLTHAKMELLEKYVRDQGGGLLVVGGSQSYGAGGYFRTPLERVLPVDMRPPARLDMPHVGLLFVLDKSGSMGAGAEGSTKLDLAKAAAIAAADIMNSTDQVGIIGFDASPEWLLPFRQVGKGDWISEKLAVLQSDGGTDLYKAMVEAHRGIKGIQAAIKHVIVLSDGLTDKADFRSLVGRMAAEGITVSTVSVGNDADVALMADIARNGKGRGYVALDPQTIPQIFTAETLLISRDLLVEKPVQPRILSASGPMRGIPRENLPNLRGYVLTYPKPRTDLFMQVDKDPLLVSWRYGLGRVTAFTSDLSGRWGSQWVLWNAFPQWAGQVARDTMRKFLDSEVKTALKADGEFVGITADLIAKDGSFQNYRRIKAKVSFTNRATDELTLMQTAPGRYEGKFQPAQSGIHLVTIFAEDENKDNPLPVTTVPYVAPYPKEYRQLKPNNALLSKLAEETGGEMLDPANYREALARLYTPTPGKSTQAQDTWWPLAGLGLALFLIDLVLRIWPGSATTGRPTVDSPA